MFIYSAGYGSLDLFRLLFDKTIALRYWKSHLVVSKRLGSVGLFFIDPHEAAMMPHGDFSIIGLNEDALLSREADYKVIPEKADNLHQALNRLLPDWHTKGYKDLACVKVDFAFQSNDARSLNIAIHEIVQDHICVLPGKMTETPYLTDVLVNKVYTRLNKDVISLRPCDRLNDNMNMSITSDVA